MTEGFTDECLLLLERFVDGVGALFVRWNQRTGLSFDDLLSEQSPTTRSSG